MPGSRKDTRGSTRRRLLNSFKSLVLRGAEGRITVADIVRDAGVGRSTPPRPSRNAIRAAR